MPKIYKILIVITLLIVAFFLVKWVNEVRPRYEWQERIEIQSKPLYINYCYFDYSEAEECYCSERTEISGFDGSPMVSGVCYIKEKVRPGLWREK